jgi:hypothetical protein
LGPVQIPDDRQPGDEITHCLENTNRESEMEYAMTLRFESCVSKRTGEPLAAYEIEYEAWSAADHANLFYGQDFTYYQCKRCSHWHLTPKDRHTPSHPCQFCTDSSGATKELYNTPADAEARAGIIRRENHVHLRVYECPYQTGWHLTKQ